MSSSNRRVFDERVSGGASQIETDPPVADLLTPREQEIARLASRGLTNKEIGQTLEISHWTVATHMRRIFDKTKIKRRSALGIALIASS